MFAEYECFSYGLDKIESLDVDLCVDYESFSFAPIITYHFCESFKSEFLESILNTSLLILTILLSMPRLRDL